jgi:hypothetical protein
VSRLYRVEYILYIREYVSTWAIEVNVAMNRVTRKEEDIHEGWLIIIEKERQTNISTVPYMRCTMKYNGNSLMTTSILTCHRNYLEQEWGSPWRRPCHCTSTALKPAKGPNRIFSSGSFFPAGRAFALDPIRTKKWNEITMFDVLVTIHSKSYRLRWFNEEFERWSYVCWSTTISLRMWVSIRTNRHDIHSYDIFPRISNANNS